MVYCPNVSYDICQIFRCPRQWMKAIHRLAVAETSRKSCNTVSALRAASQIQDLLTAFVLVSGCSRYNAIVSAVRAYSRENRSAEKLSSALSFDMVTPKVCILRLPILRELRQLARKLSRSHKDQNLREVPVVKSGSADSCSASVDAIELPLVSDIAARTAICEMAKVYTYLGSMGQVF